VGTPHFSLAECATLERLLAEAGRPLRVDFYVNTSRYILWEMEASGQAARLQAAGVQFVTDTCTYIAPVMRQTRGTVMTNSGKWAHYAPANIGVRVACGSLRECVRSAVEGKVWFDETRNGAVSVEETNSDKSRGSRHDHGRQDPDET
jgi:predicted aconitase